MKTMLITSAMYKKHSKKYNVERESKNDYSRVVFIDNGFRLLKTSIIDNPTRTLFDKLFGLNKTLCVYNKYDKKGILIEEDLISKFSTFKNMDSGILNENFVLVVPKKKKK